MDRVPNLFWLAKPCHLQRKGAEFVCEYDERNKTNSCDFKESRGQRITFVLNPTQQSAALRWQDHSGHLIEHCSIVSADDWECKDRGSIYGMLDGIYYHWETNYPGAFRDITGVELLVGPDYTSRFLTRRSSRVGVATNHKQIAQPHGNRFVLAGIFRRISLVWLGAWVIIIVARHVYGDPTHRWAYVVALSPAKLFYAIPLRLLTKWVVPQLLLIYVLGVAFRLWEMSIG